MACTVVQFVLDQTNLMREVYMPSGYVEKNWVFDANKYAHKIKEFLEPYSRVRGNLSEASRKYGIDLALLTKLSKADIDITPHYLQKLLRRELMKVRDFVTLDQIRAMEDKDEQSFWLKMLVEENKEFSYFVNQAILQGKGNDLMEAAKKIVMG